MSFKIALAVGAAISALSLAATANAAALSSQNVTISGGVPGLAVLNGTGTGVLDTTGSFTVNFTDTETAAGFTATTTGQDVFTGASFAANGTFTATGGTETELTCSGSAAICGTISPNFGKPTTFNSASGTVSLASGGALTASFTEFGQTDTNHYTIAPSPVPIPAALWLFGSGLLGMFNIVRRRTDA